MMGKLYAALRQANVAENDAIAAAEEAAGYENRIAQIGSTLRLHTWILSLNTAALAAILGKLFLH